MKSRLVRLTGFATVLFVCFSFILPKWGIVNHPLEAILTDALNNWDAKLEEKGGPDRDADGTALEEGLRYKYAVLNEYMNINRLGEIMGVPVFLKGPHSDGVDYESDEFGHYNPAFLNQVRDALSAAKDNSAFNAIVQPFYNSQLKSTARTYYRAYKYLESEDDILGKYGDYYDGEAFRGYADIEEAEGFNWYESATAPGFWVRRKIDGTDKIFFEILNMMLKKYDSGFYDEPITSHLAHKIGQGMSTWGSMSAGKTNPNHDEDGTVLTTGIRYKYAVLKEVLSLKTLEKLTGEPVFKSGPHEDEMDYNSDEFGHYNVVFLERMKGFLYGAMDSKIFNRFASNYYDNELRAMVRTYYRTYKYIESEGDVISKYGTTYQSSAFRAFADAEEEKGYDWYDSDTAAWFWIRRKADGTEGYFLQIIETLLNKYDPDFER